MKLQFEVDGFEGVAEWDEEREVWLGRVLNLGDSVVTFQSDSTDDLNQAMQDAIAEHEMQQMNGN